VDLSWSLGFERRIAPSYPTFGGWRIALRSLGLGGGLPRGPWDWVDLPRVFWALRGGLPRGPWDWEMIAPQSLGCSWDCRGGLLRGPGLGGELCCVVPGMGRADSLRIGCGPWAWGGGLPRGLWDWDGGLPRGPWAWVWIVLGISTWKVDCSAVKADCSAVPGLGGGGRIAPRSLGFGSGSPAMGFALRCMGLRRSSLVSQFS
jgi:hypothetical protein